MKLSVDNRNIFLQALKNLEVSIGRTIVFAYLQGSQNYDLETPSSDMDGKAFCLPSLDDLYDGSFLSKTFDYPPRANHDPRCPDAARTSGENESNVP